MTAFLGWLTAAATGAVLSLSLIYLASRWRDH